jgi:hypothetical protein
MINEQINQVCNPLACATQGEPVQATPFEWKPDARAREPPNGKAIHQ